MTTPPATLATFALLVALVLLIRFFLRSWVTPPAFCAVYWALFVAVNLCFPEYPMWSGGLLYIGAVLLVFALGHYLVTRLLLVRRTQPWPHRRLMRKISPLPFRGALALQLVAGLAYIALLQRMGVQQVEHIGWPVQLLLISHFLGPIFAGLLLGGGVLRGMDRFLALLVLLPALVISILYTGRTAFIGPAVLLATGFLAGTVVRRPRLTPLFSWPRAMLAVTAFAAIICYGTGIYVLRVVRGAGGSLDQVGAADLAAAFDTNRWQESYQSIRTSIFGQPSAFTVMLREYYLTDAFTPYHGRFMFAGPLVLLGADRPLHANYVGPDGVGTNVYTIFAPPIEDFGAWGSLVWWGALGAGSAVAWRLAQAGRLAGSALLVIMLINFQIGSCFLFRYNSVIGAYVIALAGCGGLDRLRLWRINPKEPPRL